MVQYIKSKDGRIEENPEDIPFDSVYVINDKKQVVENKRYANKDIYIKDKENKIVRG